MHRALIFKLPLLLSAVAVARPQTPADTSALSGLPACAQDAANAALASSGCPVNDQNCICSSQAFISAITTAVTQTCSPADVQAALVFGQNFCGAALGGPGGSSSSSGPLPTVDAGDTASSTVPIASPTDSGDNASTTTVPGTVTSMTSVADATDNMMTTNPSASILPSSVTGMMTTTQCTTTTTMMTTVASRPTGAYNATYTGGAAALRIAAGQGVMAAVMGVAGAVALL
ncbi:uncharacterized protein Z519_01030 [Cladophialophora bantiana CBS 173.52]|uniref:CFEM domain-containing protein n=1 Tax=Cladophialophora bantiana (strain ATCC 10958 / CBS 173.52 / CDC B-1940 / NIH 8579) TaxID=1442370 RepID=A0A0D2F5G5_CLAB1|nr:uncharacterized protein Z519_01030 [Cladophialophora bantiana CBS 173.52]KIW97446.1 hypothetical protein Z519_01030 [Cladophialophora bantiana CBS 173.52]